MVSCLFRPIETSVFCTCCKPPLCFPTCALALSSHNIILWFLQKLLHLSQSDNCGQAVVLERLCRISRLRRPLSDEKAFNLFITTYLDPKLHGNIVSFIMWWPGSQCFSTQPPSVSSLKMFPSWTPVFLILCPRSPRLGQVPAGCDRQQTRCLHLITVTVSTLIGKGIMIESFIYKSWSDLKLPCVYYLLVFMLYKFLFFLVCLRGSTNYYLCSGHTKWKGYRFLKRLNVLSQI